MIVLENKNLENFRKMFSYIPKKIFPSILFSIEKDDDRTMIKFSDMDINQSLVLNISADLCDTENFNAEDASEESFRIPLTKSFESVISNFNYLVLENNLLKGKTAKKEVELSMFVNESEDLYNFPTTAEEMLEFTKEVNERDDILVARFVLTEEDLKEIYSCIKVVDTDKDDILLNFTANKKSETLVIQSKDTVGNNFKYTVEGVETNDTFRAKYDRYLVSIFDVLRQSKREEYKLLLSNLMFGTDFTDEDLKVMLAVTVFEKM